MRQLPRTNTSRGWMTRLVHTAGLAAAMLATGCIAPYDDGAAGARGDCDRAGRSPGPETPAAEMCQAGVPIARNAHELHIFGINSVGSGFDDNGVGQPIVQLIRPGHATLALVAYEPSHWTLLLNQGVSLDKILLYGHHAQSVDAPEGVPVEVHGFEQTGEDVPLGYIWPTDEQYWHACTDVFTDAECARWDADGVDWRLQTGIAAYETLAMVDRVEADAGLVMSTFLGCYVTNVLMLFEHREGGASGYCSGEFGGLSSYLAPLDSCCY